jgi:hypothetical protein
MVLRFVAIALFLVACGKVEGASDTPDAMPDPGAPDAAPPDAEPGAPDAAPPRCNPRAPFQRGEPITTINTDGLDEDSARLSPDEKTLYYAHRRSPTGGDVDIYVATRASLAAMFGDARPLPGRVNTTGTERQPSITADGLWLYVNTHGTLGSEISFVHRDSVDQDFGALQIAARVNGDGQDGSPYILPDHRAMYFDSAAVGAGTWDIYRAPRVGDTFDTPQKVPGLNLNTDGASEGGPSVTPNELTMVFWSDRPGGKGLADIYVTTRASVADGFGEPENLANVNTGGTEYPTWISADGCVLYYTAQRTIGEVTQLDLFVSQRGT